MDRFWFVSIDTARLQRTIVGAVANRVRSALRPAAAAAGVALIEASIVDCGIRAVIGSRDLARVRVFVRRCIALSATAGIRWRSAYRCVRLGRDQLGTARAYVRHMPPSEVLMIATSSKAKHAGATRKLASLVPHIERNVDRVLGIDGAAARVRRYVAEHDAPPDDRTAFARLCTVVFAQGIGYEIVGAKATEFEAAFSGFRPDAVAAFTDAKVTELLSAPIVRNATKIRACIENARRWTALAQENGTYLARVAQLAAVDDPAAGWAELAAALQSDFARMGESTAGQTLKRWGFFTAFAHPGARRAVERLGCIPKDTPAPALQLLIGGSAVKLGRDPYALEAVLALFAGIGPCKKTPVCGECALADRCPSAMAPA